jgi:hypothetical protein
LHNPLVPQICHPEPFVLRQAQDAQETQGKLREGLSILLRLIKMEEKYDPSVRGEYAAPS